MFTSLLNNRYLVWQLVSRDLKSRYLGSLIGVFWSILNPLLQLAIYTVVFSTVAAIRFPGSFAEYLFCALLPWMAVQEGVTRSSRTFIENSILIKKVRFPLEILPFSLAASAFIHQFLATIVFVAILSVNQSLKPQLLGWVFVLFFFQTLLIYGLSLLVACLNVFFRDIAQVLGVLFMLGFWLTPIVYPRSTAPAKFAWLLGLNPLTHMIEAYHFVFFGNPRPSMPGLLFWLGTCCGAYFVGRFMLARTREELVDLV